MHDRDRTKVPVFPILLIAVTGLAIGARAAGVASTLEAASFVTGAVAVWLTVRESVWNFPVGLANVATFFFVFADARLLADAGLQVVYFGLIAVGWAHWLRGGGEGASLPVTHAPRAVCLRVAVAGAVAAVVLWQVVSRWGGSASAWDAATTAGSLCAQWLLNGKRVESWYVWIAVDLIYVPLYLSRSLYLTALLYTVFLAMAAAGLSAWKASARTGSPSR